jgi:hypothetical protein
VLRCAGATDRSAERISRLIGEEGGKVLTNFSNASLASQCKKRSGYPGFPSTFLLSIKPRTYDTTPSMHTHTHTHTHTRTTLQWTHLGSMRCLALRRTLKYLLSVAAGLPTIHYNWLIHCCQQRCLLPHSLYLLPAGYSVEKGSDVFMYVCTLSLSLSLALMPRACWHDTHPLSLSL